MPGTLEKLLTSFFSIVSSVSVMVVFVKVSLVPLLLNFGSPTIVVFVDVTSLLNVSSSSRRDVPGVGLLVSESSSDFDGEDDKSLSMPPPRDVFDGEEVNRVVEVLIGDPEREVVVVVDVVDE